MAHLAEIVRLFVLPDIMVDSVRSNAHLATTKRVMQFMAVPTVRYKSTTKRIYGENEQQNPTITS